MAYHEGHGKSLKEMRDQKKKEGLHHLRIHAHPHGTPDKPKWLVLHHASEDDANPEGYEFDSGAEMLGHVAEHSGVSMPDSGEEEEA